MLFGGDGTITKTLTRLEATPLAKRKSIDNGPVILALRDLLATTLPSGAVKQPNATHTF